MVALPRPWSLGPAHSGVAPPTAALPCLSFHTFPLRSFPLGSHRNPGAAAPLFWLCTQQALSEEGELKKPEPPPLPRRPLPRWQGDQSGMAWFQVPTGGWDLLDVPLLELRFPCGNKQRSGQELCLHTAPSSLQSTRLPSPAHGVLGLGLGGSGGWGGGPLILSVLGS